MNDLWRIPVPPYEVQKVALQMSHARPRWAHFLEQGLGKTLLTLAEFRLLADEKKVETLLVVCPNSLKLTWVEEAARAGIEGRAWPDTILNRGMMQAINYEAILTTSGAAWLRALVESTRVMMVLDESAHIKNPRAKRTRALLQIAPRCPVRRLLSGAPMVQGPHDLWAQLRFLDALSYNFFVFRSRFCRMGGWMGKQVIGVSDELGLRNLLRVWSFRATKAEWTDIPEKIYETRAIEMTGPQKAMYADMLNDFYALICPHQPVHEEKCPTPKEVTAELVITQLLRLQQISSGFTMTEGGTIVRIPGADGKARIVQEIIDEATGKVMVVTLYRHSTAFMMEQLAAYNPVTIHGGMKAEELQAQKRKFNEDDACRVIVVQVQAGRYGHTLLGSKESRCATVVFYENSYSLDARIQTEDRVHRFGQDRSVVYVDLTSSRVDRAVIRALQHKRNIATAVMDTARP